MQSVVAIIIVCLAVFYLVRNLVKKLKGNNSCECGCDSCSSSRTCDENDKK